MTSNHPPLIGITADLYAAQRNGNRTGQEASLFLPQRYCRAIEATGGLPVVLPATGSAIAPRRLIERIDGLVISGGNFDIHPSFYGEKPIKQIGAIKHERTEFELELTAWALRRDLPLFGICGGAQAINVALGGSLYQDIAAQLPDAGQHQKSAREDTGGHRIQIRRGTQLESIVKRRTLEVNTTHHQAVKRLGKGLVVNATAEDGLIEGIESSDHSFVLGVQWHPERLAAKNLHQRKIFSFFISTCKRLRRAT